MIETIIRESKDVEAKAVEAENSAQAAYETFVADTNDSIAAASEDITNKSEASAKAEKDKIMATEDLRETTEELLKLGEESVGLHQQCDYLLEHFTERQASRTAEMEALASAKAILNGADFGLVQQ